MKAMKCKFQLHGIRENTIIKSGGMSRSLEAPTYATLLHLLSQAQAFPAHYPKPGGFAG